MDWRFERMNATIKRLFLSIGKADQSCRKAEWSSQLSFSAFSHYLYRMKSQNRQNEAINLPQQLVFPQWMHLRWVQHLALWTIYMLSNLINDQNLIQLYPSLYIEYFLPSYLIVIPFSYVLILWLVPRYLYQGRLVLFLVLAALKIVLECMVNYWFTLSKKDLFISLSPVWKDDEISITDAFSLSFLFSLFIVGVKLAKDIWMSQQARDQEERLRLKGELQYLQTQISPHFLLNNLNTLYGLSLTDPKAVPELTLRLSDLLRFSLYETLNGPITLAREWRFLQDYIELLSARASEKLEIGTHFSDEKDEKYGIAPLLLLVFVENAFKYAQANQQGDRFLEIKVERIENELHFLSRNSFQEKILREKNSTIAQLENKGAGLGLGNVKRRLELLYPGKHILKISQETGIFLVELDLQLESWKKPA